MTSIVVHYQEIALKGRNRPYFISKLVHNLRKQTVGLDVKDVRALMGRIEIVLGPTASYDLVKERVERVFGIANFSRAGRAPRTFEGVADAVLADLEGLAPASFRVSAKRGDKSFPMTSPQLERELGARIVDRFGWRVNLDHPEMTVMVEVLRNQAFYSFGKERAPAGCRPASAGGWRA